MAKLFEDLACWQLAADLDADVYKMIKACLINKEYSLRDQILSSSGSVADNIAEGFERGGNKEFVQFLYIAKGSCGELRSQIHRSFRRELIDAATHQNYVDRCMDVSSKISNFITYLRNSGYKGEKFK